MNTIIKKPPFKANLPLLTLLLEAVSNVGLFDTEEDTSAFTRPFEDRPRLGRGLYSLGVFL